MGRDPYEVLGIEPTASLAEAEDAYHARMRLEHPDLHHGAGPERVAEAERRTRELTSAISSIRDERTIRADVRAGAARPRPDGAAEDGGGSSTSGAGGPAWDDPEPEPATAPCPWCGQRFARPTELKDHVFDEHDLRLDRRARPGLFGGRLHRMTRAASHLPLWSMIPINLAAATVIGLGVTALTDETVGGWAAAITMTPSVAALLDRAFDLVR